MSIPYLANEKDGRYLVVDGAPFLALGGELHNSSGSDLAYMEKVVWPSLRKLGGNFYLTPVYWEAMEPQRGVYDFKLVDGIIDQARREGVKLGLLWFGTWKNGSSDYVPQWLKNNHDLYFLFESEEHKPVFTISPFCEEVIELDKKAFAVLMKHIKEYDAEENTVIVVQVENEIGAWHHARDFCKQAETAFYKDIPEEVKEEFGVTGVWEEAFGQEACDYFMSYYYAKAVEKITMAGKAEYPLPMFVNAVVDRCDARPIGAPDSPMHRMWMKFTPSIDFYSPDIYVPWFKKIVDEYHHEGNPLFIPETTGRKEACANLIYALGAHNCFGFSPFAIERLFMETEYPDPFSMGMGWLSNKEYGYYLKHTYEIAWAIWPEIRKAHAEKRIHAYLNQESDASSVSETIVSNAETLYIQEYCFRVNYGSRGADENTPNAAGMIIELGKNEFMFFGVNSSVSIEPKEDMEGSVFVIDKWEYYVSDGKLIRGRNMNGDERSVTGCGQVPGVFRFKVDCFEGGTVK